TAEEWKSEAPEEIRGTKPESVSVPSEMASHAAYGFDELLSASAPNQVPAEVTPALASVESASAPQAASQPEGSLTHQSDGSAEAEFVISPVQFPSTDDFGGSSGFGSDVQKSAPAEAEAPTAGATKGSLLERFDAILKDGFSAPKASG